jgi:hypothetical protein
MSPMRLLLEGPDLQTLLERIRTEYGAGARIVEAEKVRRGGVGGFFARERFNIQVEVSDVQAAPQRVPGHDGSPVQSVMDLVDRLNREEEALHQHVLEAAPATPPVRAPAALTFSSAFASASAATAGPAATHATAGPAAPAAEPAARAPSAIPPQVSVIRPLSASYVPVSTQSASFADILSRLEKSIHPRALAPARASGGAGTPVGEATSGPTVVAHALPESTSSSTQRAAARSPLPTGTQMAARATRMGVPLHVLAGTEDPADVYRRLLSWVQSRPTAPMIVSTAGQVIVVVGEVTAAMGVAGRLALELGVDSSAIHLAVPASSSGHDVPVGRLLSDVSDIAMRRVRWQQSAASTIVVVEAALPPAARAWLFAVVSALAPTFTWAVAQASTKVNDVVSWASAIGHVDALALVNVQATEDPAAALAGPLPVGLLDGQRASVPRWMAMLTEEGEHR